MGFFKKTIKKIKKKKPIRTAVKKTVKTIKKKKPIRKAAQKATKAVSKTVKNAIKSVKDLSSEVINEINRFEDKTGIPAKVIVSVLLQGPSPRTITYAVETRTKKGSKRFSLSKQTLDLFNEYKKS